MKHFLIKIGSLAFWLGWPAFYLYMRWSRRTRVIISADQRVLLVRGWLSLNKWELPGGGLHKKEDPWAGAVREVMEETAIDLSGNNYKLIGQGMFSENGIKRYIYSYETKLPQRGAIKPRQFEIAQALWVPIPEVKNYNLTKISQGIFDSWII